MCDSLCVCVCVCAKVVWQLNNTLILTHMEWMTVKHIKIKYGGMFIKECICYHLFERDDQKIPIKVVFCNDSKWANENNFENYRLKWIKWTDFDFILCCFGNWNSKTTHIHIRATQTWKVHLLDCAGCWESLRNWLNTDLWFRFTFVVIETHTQMCKSNVWVCN